MSYVVIDPNFDSHTLLRRLRKALLIGLVVSIFCGFFLSRAWLHSLALTEEQQQMLEQVALLTKSHSSSIEVKLADCPKTFTIQNGEITSPPGNTHSFLSFTFYSFLVIGLGILLYFDRLITKQTRILEEFLQF